jgi:hypothetical protein
MKLSLILLEQASGNNTIRDVGIIAGLVISLITLIWRIIDEFRSYLLTEIETEVLNAGVMITITIENKSYRPKAIDKMFLIISQNDFISDEIIEKLTEEAGCPLKIKLTNDLERIDVNKFEKGYFDDKGNGILSLPFFYEENVRIADEKLSCRKFIPKETFPEKDKPYFIRLFVFARNYKHFPILNRLHRTNHTLFVIPNESLESSQR